MPDLPIDTPKVRQRRPVLVRFLTGERQDFFLDELPALLRHPRVLAYFAGSISVCFLVSVLLGRPGAKSYILLMPILTLATLVGIGVFLLWVLLAARVHRTGQIRIHLSLPLGLCAAVVQGVTLGLWESILGIPVPTLSVTLLAVMLIYLLDEALLLVILRPVAARIVADVRSFTGPPAPRRALQPSTADMSGHLLAGSQRLPLDTLLRLEASGNYVQVWNDGGTMQVPGPFSALITQLPAGLGCLVHRSDWVATRAVDEARRDGRATLLVLTNGTTVRVASTRAGHVRDWLAQFTARQPRRRGQSSGGGETKRQSRPAPETTTSAIGGTAPSSPKTPDKPTKS